MSATVIAGRVCAMCFMVFTENGFAEIGKGGIGEDVIGVGMVFIPLEAVLMVWPGGLLMLVVSTMDAGVPPL